MKILFISTEPPYPPSNGVKIKTFNLIKGLFDRGHEINLITFSKDSASSNDIIINKLKQYCKSLRFFQLNNQPIELIKNAVRNISAEEIINFRYIKKDFEKAIKETINEKNIELVHFDLISSTHYIKSINKSTPCIASINDSYSLWLKNKLQRIPVFSVYPMIEKVYYSATFPLATRYEKKMYRSFEKVHVVSDVDKTYLHKLNPNLDIEVIPNGVDTEYFKPLESFTDGNCLVFVATMNGENAANAIWFIRNVFPKVNKLFPDLKLYLVGKDPDPNLVKEAQRLKGVIVTGYVKDIRPYVYKASIIVDPTMKTCGILNHVLQSMSMGKTVIGTSSSFLAIRGAVPWKHMVVSKDKKEFIENIAFLLKNAEKNRVIGINARNLIEKNYQWSTTISMYEKMYFDAIVAHKNGNFSWKNNVV